MSGFTFHEFFAGGGMARAGLGGNWACLFANDIDPKKADAYAANWGNDGLQVGDIAGVASFEVVGTADLAWASFPCQDLSLAGNGAGLQGKRSGTFWPFWRLIQQMKREQRAPRTIIVENVCGLLTSHGGADFAMLCRALGNEGYHYGAMVVDAELFVPQSRPRLFLIAIRDDLAVPDEMVSASPNRHWHPARLIEAHDRLIPPLQSRWIWFDPDRPPRRDIELPMILEQDSGDLRWHDPEETTRLIDMMSIVNRQKLCQAQAHPARSIGTVYRRTRTEGGQKAQRAEVRFDGVAGCLRTPSGGSSRQTVMIIEQGAVRSRLLTARETARLMGLPDTYRLPVRYNDAYHLTGDGVVVPVVRFLADRIVEPILRRDDVRCAIAAE